MQRRRIAYTVCLGFALMLVSTAALAQYKLTNLDSNQIGAAKHVDPLQVNGWGLALRHGRTLLGQRPRIGLVHTLYGSGNQRRLGSIDSLGKRRGTGATNRNCGQCVVGFPVGGWPTFFLFATLDGTIERLGSGDQSQRRDHCGE